MQCQLLRGVPAALLLGQESTIQPQSELTRGGSHQPVGPGAQDGEGGGPHLVVLQGLQLGQSGEITEGRGAGAAGNGAGDLALRVLKQLQLPLPHRAPLRQRRPKLLQLPPQLRHLPPLRLQRLNQLRVPRRPRLHLLLVHTLHQLEVAFSSQDHLLHRCLVALGQGVEFFVQGGAGVLVHAGEAGVAEGGEGGGGGFGCSLHVSLQLVVLQLPVLPLHLQLLRRALHGRLKSPPHLLVRLLPLLLLRHPDGPQLPRYRLHLLARGVDFGGAGGVNGVRGGDPRGELRVPLGELGGDGGRQGLFYFLLLGLAVV
mmetsp:Transcript_42046/g.110748  ORF Transcript_42046/g.110748 Transcript_42046/m.110748 type:complete len:314 (-) Transcript_42046:3-944(-)